MLSNRMCAPPCREADRDVLHVPQAPHVIILSLEDRLAENENQHTINKTILIMCL